MLAIAFGIASFSALAGCVPYLAIISLIIDNPGMMNDAGDLVIARFEIAVPLVAALTIGLSARCLLMPTIPWAISMVVPAVIWWVGMALALGKS